MIIYIYTHNIVGRSSSEVVLFSKSAKAIHRTRILYFILFPALLSAAIFGNVSSIMLRIYQGTDEYHEKMQSIKDFINFHHLPKHLASRLQESFSHAWTYTNGIDMNSVRTRLF